MEIATFNISGMACGGCANTVRQAVLALAGVIDAEVSHVEAQAVVTFAPEKVTSEQIKAAIQSAGYQVV
jgi:copper chaperone CopZ